MDPYWSMIISWPLLVHDNLVDPYWSMIISWRHLNRQASYLFKGTVWKLTWVLRIKEFPDNTQTAELSSKHTTSFWYCNNVVWTSTTLFVEKTSYACWVELYKSLCKHKVRIMYKPFINYKEAPYRCVVKCVYMRSHNHGNCRVRNT